MQTTLKRDLKLHSFEDARCSKELLFLNQDADTIIVNKAPSECNGILQNTHKKENNTVIKRLYLSLDPMHVTGQQPT